MNCGSAVFSGPYYYREGLKLPSVAFSTRDNACRWCRRHSSLFRSIAKRSRVAGKTRRAGKRKRHGLGGPWRVL